jgi:predicted small secreted protein
MNTHITPPIPHSSKALTMKMTALLLLTFASGLLASCNTAKGAGRDIKHVGHKIEEAAHQ